jgi:cytochrome c oxidase cbb3-type subunit 3
VTSFERDPHTGYLTTGHDWNGITELNTPVPRPVYVFLILTVAFSLVYWVLMPAWPIGVTYTKGLLGIDQRTTVHELLKRAESDRRGWTDRIAAESYSNIQSDPQLMQTVRETGRALFGDNCAACHGIRAQGGNGFPDLTTRSWLWGGDPETIAETIRVGINSSHPEARTSQMMAFGHDGLLSRVEVEHVVDYVRSLSDASQRISPPAPSVGAGQTIFAENCAACHGENGQGKTEMGAPNLADTTWIYGGDLQSVFTTVWGGRRGIMPTWEDRLSPIERKILALYLVDLRASRP